MPAACASGVDGALPYIRSFARALCSLARALAAAESEST